MLEMHLLGESNPNETSSTTTSEWKESRWVGRRLRAEQLIDLSTRDERLWLQGKQTRVVTLEPSFVTAVLEEFDAQDVAYAPTVRQPREFYQDRPCEECPYGGFCSMRPRKEKR